MALVLSYFKLRDGVSLNYGSCYLIGRTEWSNQESYNRLGFCCWIEWKIQ